MRLYDYEDILKIKINYYGETKTAYDAAAREFAELKMHDLYEWIVDENRKPAYTYFTAGQARNIAREFEFQLKKSAPPTNKDFDFTKKRM